MNTDSINKIKEFSDNHLTEKRKKHTEGVISTAVHFANIYGEDAEKARLAAQAHDMYKKITDDELSSYVDEIGLDEIYRHNNNLAHGKIAAYFLKKQFGIDDDDIINAVSYHTTGRANMSLLEKIIYLADAIEPNRDYPGVDELREIAETDLDRACWLSMKRTVDYVKERNQYLDKDTLAALISLENIIEKEKQIG